jgi:tetratricopeptide (TPR) repeat protein
MSRLKWLLAGVIAVELAVSAYFVAGRLREKTPPAADLTIFDPITAEQLRALDRACRQSGKPADWAKLGEAYLAYGYFPESAACYGVAQDLAPNDADLAFKHGFALDRLGQTTEANACYRRAIELKHPRSSDCWYYIGRNHLREEDDASAKPAFEKTKDLPAGRYELAKMEARLSGYREVPALLEQLLAEYADRVEPNQLRCRIETLRGRPHEAAVYSDRTTRARQRIPVPFDIESKWALDVFGQLGGARLVKIAERQLAAGARAEAGRNLRVAIAAEWAPELADQLAEVAFQEDRPDEALRLLQEIIDREGPSAHVFWRLGDAYEALKLPEKARAIWERAVAMGTGWELKDLHFKLSTSYEQAGDKGHAAHHMARAYLKAGMLEFWMGDLNDARTAFAKATEIEPDLAHAWFYLGEVARLTNHPADARPAYERCLALNPGHGGALRGRALLPAK